MQALFGRHRWRLPVLVLAGLALAGGVAYATIPDSGGVIHGCYKTQNGQLRVVPAGESCLSSEQAIQWNQGGPTGPQGPPGDKGPVGDKGTGGRQRSGRRQGAERRPGAERAARRQRSGRRQRPGRGCGSESETRGRLETRGRVGDKGPLGLTRDRPAIRARRCAAREERLWSAASRERGSRTSFPQTGRARGSPSGSPRRSTSAPWSDSRVNPDFSDPPNISHVFFSTYFRSGSPSHMVVAEYDQNGTLTSGPFTISMLCS